MANEDEMVLVSKHELDELRYFRANAVAEINRIMDLEKAACLAELRQVVDEKPAKRREISLRSYYKNREAVLERNREKDRLRQQKHRARARESLYKNGKEGIVVLEEI